MTNDWKSKAVFVEYYRRSLDLCAVCVHVSHSNPYSVFSSLYDIGKSILFKNKSTDLYRKVMHSSIQLLNYLCTIIFAMVNLAPFVARFPI